jgi:hypothetical protein
MVVHLRDSSQRGKINENSQLSAGLRRFFAPPEFWHRA